MLAQYEYELYDASWLLLKQAEAWMLDRYDARRFQACSNSGCRPQSTLCLNLNVILIVFINIVVL